MCFSDLVDLDDADFGPSMMEQEDMIDQMIRKYKLVDRDVVKMALEAFHWKVDDADSSVKELNDEVQARNERRRRMMEEMNASTSYEPEPVEEYTFPSFDDTADRERQEREEREKREREEQQQREERERIGRRVRNEERREAERRRASTQASSSRSKQERRARQAAERRAREEERAEQRAANAARSQGRERSRRQETSAPVRKSEAVGRDPELSNGRDPALASGPTIEVHGRDKSLAKGQ